MKALISPWFPIPEGLLARLTQRVARLSTDAFAAGSVAVLSAGGAEGIQIQDEGDHYLVVGWQRVESEAYIISVSPSCVDMIPGTRKFLDACHRAAAGDEQPVLLGFEP